MNIAYVFNADTQLWYPLLATGSGDTLTLAVGQDGVASPPDYLPSATEPLCSVETYMVVHGLEVLDMSLERWTFLALTVSEAVESWCSTSFRVAVTDPLLLESDPDFETETVTPPSTGLQVVVARMIKDYEQGLAQKQGLKSETLRNYSYVIDGDSTGFCSRYGTDLKPYRRLHGFS